MIQDPSRYKMPENTFLINVTRLRAFTQNGRGGRMLGNESFWIFEGIFPTVRIPISWFKLSNSVKGQGEFRPRNATWWGSICCRNETNTFSTTSWQDCSQHQNPYNRVNRSNEKTQFFWKSCCGLIILSLLNLKNKFNHFHTKGKCIHHFTDKD